MEWGVFSNILLKRVFIAGNKKEKGMEKKLIK
jgi:hypothetical protein